MPLPRRLDRDVCGLMAPPWSLDPDLATKLARLEEKAHQAFRDVRLPGLPDGLPWPGLRIISGHRTPAANDAAKGVKNSLHLLCPSLAADLRFGTLPVSMSEHSFWAWLGAEWLLMGGRWGGNFRDPDVNHFDLGVGPE